MKQELDNTEERLRGFETERGAVTELVAWADKHQLTQVIACRPEVGALNDQLPDIEASLQRAGIRLVLLTRKEDLDLQSLATGGFFSFCKKIEPRIRTLK